ncbi:MAG: SUMF1/EgtB/PvdO family nonheme iron enzyme [Actinomycetales bacterium]
MKFTTSVVLLALALSSAAGAQTCRSDLNGDGQVNGADLGILLADWGFCPATISSVTPAQGGTQGGTVISITGTGLQTTTQVRIGGVACTNVSVLTPTLVRATTPPGQPGEASVAVTTNGGTTLASTPFTYVQQQITSVVPNSGPYVGGTSITINGQFLAGATAVTVGGVPCTNVVSVSSTQVTAVTPAGSVGSADVAVACAKGTVTAAGAFTYLSVIVPSWATVIEVQPDPAVVTDPALRAAIIATGRPWRVRDTVTQIEMLLVPPGTFRMGCVQPPNGQSCVERELLVHDVTLTSGFYLGRFEITAGQFAGQADGSRIAASGMTWNAAVSFLEARGMRLPTEAEWEYACKAGTSMPYHGGPGFPQGSTDPNHASAIAWFGSVTTAQEVGGKAPNALGFHDMIGNVWENVADFYGTYPESAQVDPTGPQSGSSKVHRGGSVTDPVDHPSGFVRSTGRSYFGTNDTSNNVGFRAARNP